MRALVLLLCLVSGSAWAGEFAAPWRSDMWPFLAPHVQWLIVMAAAIIPLMLAVACLTSKVGRERRLGLLVVLLMGAGWGNFARLTGTVQYVNRSCSVNGDGTVSTCVGGGTSGGSGSPGAPGAFNTATSTLTVASGNTSLFCGAYNAAYSVPGVSYTSGQHTLSGACPGNPGTSNTTFITFGGGSRAHIKIEDFTFTGGSVAINLTGASGNSTDNVIRRITCTDLTSACIQLNPSADTTISTTEIYDIDCTNIGTGGADDGITYGTAGDGIGDHPLGACVSVVGAAQGGGTASGLSTGILIHDIDCYSDGLVGRYCVSLYPPDNLTTGGRVRASKVYNVHASGTFRFPFINWTNDVDDLEVFNNTCEGTQSGAILHSGGQGSFSTAALAFTDRSWVHDNHLECRAVVTQDHTADAQGLYPDGGSESGIWERNSTHDNAMAGIYFYYANGHTFRSNITWGNGNNALHMHGVSDSNSFINNTFSCLNKVTPSGSGEAGSDCAQIDGTVVTGPTLKNNIIVGDSNVPKCLDADVAITESYNNIYGCSTRVELASGSIDASDLNVDPGWVGGTAPKNAEGFCLASTSSLLGAGTATGFYIPTIGGENFTNPPPIGARGLCQPRRAAATRRTRN